MALWYLSLLGASVVYMVRKMKLIDGGLLVRMEVVGRRKGGIYAK